jgi:hypothetical protein
MTYLHRAAAYAVALAVVVCWLPVACADEPEAEAPKIGQPMNLGGFEKGLPLAIGGGITVGVLCAGFFLLNAKKPQAKASFDQDPYYEPPPSRVVAAPNPLRYFAMPILFVALLAAVVPLGYSIWNSLPDGKQIVTPPKPAQFDVGTPMTGLKMIDISQFKTMDPPKFSMPIPTPGPPQVRSVTQPPPVRIPSIQPIGGRR